MPQITPLNALILLGLGALIVSHLVHRWRPKASHRWRCRRARKVLRRLRSRVGREARLPVVIGTLRRLDPFVFEEVLLESFRRNGHRIKRNRAYTGDGGIDGRVFVGRGLFLIQAKRYRGAIDPQHIRDFEQVVLRERAQGGFFVHTGRTGPSARRLAQESDLIEILSGQRLVDLVTGQLARDAQEKRHTDVKNNRQKDDQYIRKEGVRKERSMICENSVRLAGYVGAPVVLERTERGMLIGTLSLSTPDAGTNGSDRRTDWHRVILWGQKALAAAQTLDTGSAVLVEGRLQNDVFEDKDGKKRKITKVVAKRFYVIDRTKQRAADDVSYAKGVQDTPPGPGVTNVGASLPVGHSGSGLEATP